MTLVWITILLLLAYSALILFYRKAWMRIRPFQAPKGFQPATGISVIIPARNEADGIGECIRSIREQQYPQGLFECIVVDDFSTDGTVKAVNDNAWSGLRCLRMQDVPGCSSENSSKKKALTEGIAHARHGLIVTTDADCICPPRWLHTIAAFYESDKPAFIAAPVRFNEATGLLPIFQALDFLALQGITAAAASKGIHAMSNGANLAYEKEVFDVLGGFSGVDHIASGDDMLLMQKFSARDPARIGYCFSKDAIVTTAVAGSWREFLRQRIRWSSKATHYKERSTFTVLLLVYLFNFCLVLLPILSIFDIRLLFWWAGIVILKCWVELFFLFPVARFFERERLMAYFPPMQPIHMLYTVIAGSFGQIPTYEWKGRKVK